MSTIVTRAGKGSELTWDEVDANFNNLNTDKLQAPVANASLATMPANTVKMNNTGSVAAAIDATLAQFKTWLALTLGDITTALGFTPANKAGDTFTGTVGHTPAANTQAITATGYSLTGANAQSLVDLAGTWNTTGTPTAVKVNVTDTASATLSRLESWQVGGVEKAGVIKDGSIFANLGLWKSAAQSYSGSGYHGIAFPNNSSMDFYTNGEFVARLTEAGPGFSLNSTSRFAFSSTSTANGTVDVALYRNAAGVVEINNGTAGALRDIKVRQVSATAQAATDIPGIVKAAASQTANLTEWQDSAAAIHGTVTENGYFTTRKNAAPADAEIATSEAAFWFDNTVGAAKLMVKAKNSAGTVVTGSITLA